MNLPVLCAAVLAAAVVMILRNRCDKVWKKIRPLFFVIMGMFTVGLILLMLYAAWTMCGRTIFSLPEKIVYCIGIGVLIVFFVWLNIVAWKKNGEEKTE